MVSTPKKNLSVAGTVMRGHLRENFLAGLLRTPVLLFLVPCPLGPLFADSRLGIVTIPSLRDRLGGNYSVPISIGRRKGLESNRKRKRMGVSSDALDSHSQSANLLPTENVGT